MVRADLKFKARFDRKVGPIFVEGSPSAPGAGGYTAGDSSLSAALQLS
jgi:hypothetical protein